MLSAAASCNSGEPRPKTSLSVHPSHAPTDTLLASEDAVDPDDDLAGCIEQLAFQGEGLCNRPLNCLTLRIPAHEASRCSISTESGGCHTRGRQRSQSSSL